jgi:Glu-tRNA(Gln) amidotransferase subunit E-like FAD-binding protein
VTVGNKGNDISFRLDRLGIPLVEIGTAPDIRSPEHAKEVAEKLGMIIRSTGKSQRGIGVTRQDVNVSIPGGARVEIKGVQELDMIPKIIENEIKRQEDLIKKKQKPKEETRIAKPDGTTEFTRPLPGEHRLYPETDIRPVLTKLILKEIDLPEPWESKRKRFEKILPREMSEQILRSEYLDLFEKFAKRFEPIIVANVFTYTIKDLRRKNLDTASLSEEHFEKIFEAMKDRKISKEAIPIELENFIKNPNHEIKSSGMSDAELRKIIKGICSAYPNLVKEKKISALMGEVMIHVRGKCDGGTVMKILKEELR